jgi:hypothetical protein
MHLLVAYAFRQRRLVCVVMESHGCKLYNLLLVKRSICYPSPKDHVKNPRQSTRALDGKSSASQSPHTEYLFLHAITKPSQTFRTSTTMAAPQRSVCTQYQIRYTCGHSQNSQFVKCPSHDKKEDERCGKGKWELKEEAQSTHKCRLCLRSG